MTASLKIDQAGLSAGVAGKARLDGKSDGSTVTLTSVSPGTTNTFRLLYWPPTDDEAEDSLTPSGGGATPIWTFTPKAGVYGPYLIELIVDDGLPSEARQQRVFGIKGWRHGLVAPALNERGDPLARSGLTGGELTTSLARVDRNVSPSGGTSVDGWQRALVDMALAVEVGNYSQIVVPDGAVCVVPDGQQMLYHGNISGDFDGDLVEIVDAPASSGGGSGDYDFELFWTDSENDGSATEIDSTFMTDFEVEVGRINKYNLIQDIVATLPEAPNDPLTNPHFNRRVAFREMGGEPDGVLTITAQGANRIVSPFAGDAAGVTELELTAGFQYLVLHNYGELWIEVERHPSPRPWSSNVYVASGTMRPNVVSRYDGSVEGITLSFPASPALADEIEVFNIGGGAADELVTFDGNGNDVDNLGASPASTFDSQNGGFWARWKWDGVRWRMLDVRYAEVG